MKYIIMCGGTYEVWETPRHLSKVRGEEVVARTIRLLRENGITDISISSNNPIFKKYGIPVLEHNNSYVAHDFGNVVGDWFDAFYPCDEPVCYLFGDVVFSPDAIKTIIETQTDDIEFFGSKPPFADNYFKTHEEPFALKVVNQRHLKSAIEKTRELDKQGKFWRKPLMWELWTIIKDAPLQTTPGEYTADYIAINDYTCDIDRKSDIENFEEILREDSDMVRAETTTEFTLKKFNELKDIKRVDRDEEGRLFVGDTFYCDYKTAKYLNGENDKKISVIKILEVIPEEKEEVTEEVVQAVASAIVEESKEQNKPIEKIVDEIVEESKPRKTKKSKNLKSKK